MARLSTSAPEPRKHNPMPAGARIAAPADGPPWGFWQAGRPGQRFPPAPAAPRGRRAKRTMEQMVLLEQDHLNSRSFQRRTRSCSERSARAPAVPRAGARSALHPRAAEIHDETRRD
eukprot:2139873-Pyramimonas_sp.AAC.2